MKPKTSRNTYEIGDLYIAKTRLIGSFSERATENAKVWFGGKKFVQYQEEKYFWKVKLHVIPLCFMDIGYCMPRNPNDINEKFAGNMNLNQKSANFQFLPCTLWLKKTWKIASKTLLPWVSNPDRLNASWCLRHSATDEMCW